MICPTCGESIGMPKMHTATFTTSHYCMPCKEEHIVWENIAAGDYVVEWGKYRIYCNTKDNTAQIQKIYMDIESDTSIMYRWHTLLELPSIPENLSEETVESKIKLYLLFS